MTAPEMMTKERDESVTDQEDVFLLFTRDLLGIGMCVLVASNSYATRYGCKRVGLSTKGRA